jgi:hypothetical protein
MTRIFLCRFHQLEEFIFISSETETCICSEIGYSASCHFCYMFKTYNMALKLVLSVYLLVHLCYKHIHHMVKK